MTRKVNSTVELLTSTVIKKIKYTLHEIPLDSHGYARGSGEYYGGGKYYGIGSKIYKAYNPETGNYLLFRARNRKSAKKRLDAALNHTGIGLDPSFSYGELREFKGDSQ
jgi:hypothetical protein